MYITDDFVSDSFVLTTKEEEKIKRRADFLKISHSLTLECCCCCCVFVCAYTYIHTYTSREKRKRRHTHIHIHIFKSLETTSYYYASRRVRTTLLSHIIITEKVDKKNATRNDVVEQSTNDFSNNAQR